MLAEVRACRSGNFPSSTVGRYRNGELETKNRIAAEVDRGCRQVGFLLLEHHGVARPIIDRVFAVAREFFDLPLAEKRRYHPRDPVAPRGYHALATRNLAKTLGQKAPPDLREQFFIGPLRAAPERYARFEGSGEILFGEYLAGAPRRLSSRAHRALLGAGGARPGRDAAVRHRPR